MLLVYLKVQMRMSLGTKAAKIVAPCALGQSNCVSHVSCCIDCSCPSKRGQLLWDTSVFGMIIILGTRNAERLTREKLGQLYSIMLGVLCRAPDSTLGVGDVVVGPFKSGHVGWVDPMNLISHAVDLRRGGSLATGSKKAASCLFLPVSSLRLNLRRRLILAPLLDSLWDSRFLVGRDNRVHADTAD